MKKLVIGMLASGLAALFFVTTTPACSSSVDCSAPACSADTAPTADAIKACEAEKSGACGSEYNKAGSCVKGKITCTADNKTDQAGGIKALADCATEINDYTACKAKNVTADAGK